MNKRCGAWVAVNVQGEVTPIDSVVTPATAVKNFDLEFWALTA